MQLLIKIVCLCLFVQQIKPQQERVAFIGISNWALDPAKMNRGVMVTRADPSEDELIFSAKGICSNEENDPIRKILEIYFRPFAKAYISICNKQKREFFGLRDFYRYFIMTVIKLVLLVYKLQFDKDALLHVQADQLTSQ